MFSFFKKKPPLAPDAGAETSAASPSDAVANTAAAPARQSWLARLKAGLGKTASGLSSVFGGSRIDEALFEDLENALLMADAGVSAVAGDDEADVDLIAAPDGDDPGRLMDRGAALDDDRPGVDHVADVAARIELAPVEAGVKGQEQVALDQADGDVVLDQGDGG